MNGETELIDRSFTEEDEHKKRIMINKGYLQSKFYNRKTLKDQFETLDQDYQKQTANFEDTMHHPECFKRVHKSRRIEMTKQETRFIMQKNKDGNTA